MSEHAWVTTNGLDLIYRVVAVCSNLPTRPTNEDTQTGSPYRQSSCSYVKYTARSPLIRDVCVRYEASSSQSTCGYTFDSTSSDPTL